MTSEGSRLKRCKGVSDPARSVSGVSFSLAVRFVSAVSSDVQRCRNARLAAKYMIVQSSIPENSATGMIQYQGTGVGSFSCDCGDGVIARCDVDVTAALATLSREVVIDTLHGVARTCKAADRLSPLVISDPSDDQRCFSTKV